MKIIRNQFIKFFISFFLLQDYYFFLRTSVEEREILSHILPKNLPTLLDFYSVFYYFWVQVFILLLKCCFYNEGTRFSIISMLLLKRILLFLLTATSFFSQRALAMNEEIALPFLFYYAITSFSQFLIQTLMSYSLDILFYGSTSSVFLRSSSSEGISAKCCLVYREKLAFLFITRSSLGLPL